jgi:hypothetical protein
MSIKIFVSVVCRAKIGFHIIPVSTAVLGFSRGLAVRDASTLLGMQHIIGDAAHYWGCSPSRR